MQKKKVSRNKMQYTQKKPSAGETRQQLSPSDIKKNEEQYRKDLNEFVLNLIQGEKFKKNTIKKLARDLEEAGTIETHKISARIKRDLIIIQREKGLDKPLISPEYVPKVLEDKYKQVEKSKNNTKTKTKTETNITTDDKKFYHPSASTVTTAQTPGLAQFTEPPRTSPQTVKEEVDFGEWISNLYDLTMRRLQMITGYNEASILKIEDVFELISKTRQFRFDVTKRLDDPDLRTIYTEVRRDILVLNDFLKQLEQELDSRKKKEQLTSE